MPIKTLPPSERATSASLSFPSPQISKADIFKKTCLKKEGEGRKETNRKCNLFFKALKLQGKKIHSKDVKQKEEVMEKRNSFVRTEPSSTGHGTQ